MTLYEVDEAASRVRQEVDPDANIIVGATFDETLGDKIVCRSSPRGWRDRACTTHAIRSLPPPRRPWRAASIGRAAAAARPAPASRRAAARATLGRGGGAGGAWRRPSIRASRTMTSMRCMRTHLPIRRNGASWEGPAACSRGGLAQFGQSAPATAPPRPRLTPAAPAPGARRMPALQDFTPVGQREYRAKTDRCQVTFAASGPLSGDQQSRPTANAACCNAL